MASAGSLAQIRLTAGRTSQEIFSVRQWSQRRGCSPIHQGALTRGEGVGFFIHALANPFFANYWFLWAASCQQKS